MTSALNLISENCKHPFPPLCLILSISSLPEDHLSSFGVTVSYPSCQPVERQTAGLLQALCILTSCSRPSVLLSSTFIFFFFLTVLGFQVTFYWKLMILLGGFVHRPAAVSLITMAPGLYFVPMGQTDSEVYLKFVLAHFSSNPRPIE